MSKFYTGDTVRRIKNSFKGLYVNVVYKVVGVSTSGGYIRLEGQTGYYSTCNFALVSRAKEPAVQPEKAFR